MPTSLEYPENEYSSMSDNERFQAINSLEDQGRRLSESFINRKNIWKDGVEIGENDGFDTPRMERLVSLAEQELEELEQLQALLTKIFTIYDLIQDETMKEGMKTNIESMRAASNKYAAQIDNLETSVHQQNELLTRLHKLEGGQQDRKIRFQAFRSSLRNMLNLFQNRRDN